MRTWDLDMFFPGASEPHQNVDFAACQFYTAHRWSRKTPLLRRTTAFQMVPASPLPFANSTTVFRTRNRPCKGMWRSRKEGRHRGMQRRTCLFPRSRQATSAKSPGNVRKRRPLDGPPLRAAKIHLRAPWAAPERRAAVLEASARIVSPAYTI